MRTFYQPALLAALPLAGIMLSVGGCQSGAKTADQVCSATETYDALTGLMTSNLGQAINDQAGEGDDKASLASASSVAKLSQHIKFSLPTVADVNKDTKKISCNAMLTISAPQAAMSSVPSVNLPVNEQSNDHITYRVSYSVQPTADDHQNLYELEHTDDLALAAFKATLASEKLLATAVQAPVTTANDNAGQDNSSGSNDSGLTNANSSVSSDQQPVSQKISIPPAELGNISAGMKISDARQSLAAAGWKLDPFNDIYDGQCWRDNDSAPIGDQSGGCGYTFTNPDGKYLWIMADGAEQKIVSIEGYDGPPP